MSPISISVLAISMSMDAFAASIGRGAGDGGRMGFTQALRAGAVFGTIEAITPLIGWGIGVAASGFVQAIDHWIAFFLLGCVGAHMIYAALHQKEEKKSNGSLAALTATAVGTSLDAMAVGASLAMLDVNIIVVAIAVGLATFIFSAGGTTLGRLAGARLGQFAEIAAGIALFCIGLKILIEHLTA
ncbi:MAG: manganese efflux pump MntP family protein [Pseudomonadota bacterium]